MSFGNSLIKEKTVFLSLKQLVIQAVPCHLGTLVGKTPVRRAQLELSSDPGQVQTSTCLFLDT